ncbi:hypothetical protein [Streptomyces galbus]|uniref:Uncharacterized protein n=1 Tax=Streptomyces galbus TaxID=33898 RepID=A0A4U5W6Q5_STRGB|nr:hypothetical protein [Streptomyces galbus]TKS95805.1 hypothetical protein E4U92_35010 [Streptomyces galbus]GHD52418.1 hypothetical protein GCM10010335_64890 [Streptomyces galbus]
MLDRFAIDDGRHLLEVVIDEDASAAAGEAQYRADCSCGRMSVDERGERRAVDVTLWGTRVNTGMGD